MKNGAALFVIGFGFVCGALSFGLATNGNTAAAIVVGIIAAGSIFRCLAGDECESE